MLKNYDALLAKYSATREGLVNINEYGHPDEQNPSGSAWWIAQLERANIFGCRANWASAYTLHDFMAQLLGKPGAGTDDYDPKATGYYPNGEYQVYKYYASSMVGDRIKTETTMDTNGDVYATVDAEGGVLRLLAVLEPPQVPGPFNWKSSLPLVCPSRARSESTRMNFLARMILMLAWMSQST